MMDDYIMTAILLAGFLLFCWLWWTESCSWRWYRRNRFTGIPRWKQKVVCHYCGLPVRRIDARRNLATGRYCCDLCEKYDDGPEVD